MTKILPLFFLLFALSGAAHEIYPGGDSDISGTDPKRAGKAVQKWSKKDSKLAEAPYFWDHKKVGRPVFIRIIKNDVEDGLLEVWNENPASRKYELMRTYKIASFSGDPGPKLAEGDFQTPEGFYYVTRRQMNPYSDWHLGIDIGFPNTYDKSKDRTGSYIMIHGGRVSIGCFAMTDCSMEQIYTMVDRALAKGQKFVRVHSFPFAMTDENLAEHKDSEHYEFWENLKQGWDWFEKHRRPPNVTVRKGEYRFSKS